MARETEKPPDNERRKRREERALAAEKDRLVRLATVYKDTQLQLPVSIQMPDGEEFPGTQLQIRCYDQHAEIKKGYIQGPPNKTICDSSDWVDWESGSGGDVRSSHDGSKHSSKGQLFGLKLSNYSSSGKSPPSHSRPRDRHAHPVNSKTPASTSSSKHKGSSSSSSSSSCSSTSSSTTSCSGLGVNNPKSTPSQSFTEKFHTVFGEKIYHTGSGSTGAGEGSCRTSPNNNSSGVGVFSRLLDETKRATRSSSKGGSKKQQQQQLQQQHLSVMVANPNGAAGAKLTSTSVTTSTTTMMTRTCTTTLKCDASILKKEPPSSGNRATLVHQSETFSERVEEGSRGPGLGTSFQRPTMSDSQSDNNGNAGGLPPPPCFATMMSSVTSPPAASTCGSLPKTDDSKAWVTFADERGEIDSFSQTSSVHQNVSELIPRTTLSNPSPHFISQHQTQELAQDQYSLPPSTTSTVSVDVELVDQH